MFYRNAIKELESWAANPDHKPLVIRGARQVGKTTLIEMFSKEFDQYLTLNLERPAHKDLFERGYTVGELIDAIRFVKKVSPIRGRTLLFIDEIQNSQQAINYLRFLREDLPELFVVAAGSLLETLLNRAINIPVGRVEYLAIHPCNFEEFLHATDNLTTIEALQAIPFPDYAHDQSINLFNRFALIGGMPEIVSHYSMNHDIHGLGKIFDGLLASYLDDVEKYARNSSQVHVIRHLIRQSFIHAGTRIRFEGFGQSGYRSREVAEAFRILEKAMILQLVYPVTDACLPVGEDIRKSPKLLSLDSGMVNYFAKVQDVIFNSQDISDVYRGRFAEHIAGQELKSLTWSVIERLNFWVRPKVDADAEVDFIYPYKGMIFPIEVKSGLIGKMRSLHQFVKVAPHPYAVRIYSGKLSVQKENLPSGKEVVMLNLPFYLITQLENYLDWLVGQ
ncbi:MAG: AAA family ATPase [Bacteroidales bacterium]